MLQLSGICLRFSQQQIFNYLSLTLNIGDRLGIVGANGTGKSTLLNVIAGHLKADEGQRSLDKQMTVGFLSQDLPNAPSISVIDHLKNQVGINQIESRMRELELAYAEPDADLALIDREYQPLVDQLHYLGAYEFESECLKVLAGLGFKSGDENKTCTQFSGGWQMRIALAIVLLKKPQLLILDEPTNHLDTLAINWLESYVKTMKAAVVVVSHDRQFLDNTVTKISEIICSRLYEFNGNYSYYEKTKTDLMELLSKERTSTVAEDAYRFIKRHTTREGVKIYADKLARLNKYVSKFDLLNQPKPQKLKLQFSYDNRPNKHLMQLSDVAHGYGDDFLFTDVDFELQRDDRLALVGTNGTGKSTLCRLMFGEEEPMAGSVTKHESVKFAFFSQQTAEQLGGAITLWQYLQNLNLGTPDTKLRQIMAQFGFKGDAVYKFLGWLSGGEKCRFALACLLLEPANCLMLDEPTNHLDMYTKTLLVEALKAYPGTMIVVSHDRWFLNQLCNRVAWINDNHVELFRMGYAEFEEKLSA